MPPLLQINRLSIGFDTPAGRFHAVKDVSFELQAGEVLAIVGESGSGKSVTALAILQLLPPRIASIEGGEIYFSSPGSDPVNLLTLSEKEIRLLRGNRIGMIFQEPMTSLNPVMTCGRQVSESLRFHRKLNRRAAREETIRLFEKVKLPEPERLFDRYPHQLSGGQKQRVMIAMAICCRPALLICDEPTTALDVTVQKTILELLRELCRSEQMGMIFITHDLGLVAEMADRAVVMNKGEVVESGMVQPLFSNPKHPYTRGLLFCRPVLHRKGERLPVVSDFLKPANGTAEPKNSLGDDQVGQILFPETKGRPEKGSVLMKVRDLNIWYGGSKGRLGMGKRRPVLKAVQNVSFDILAGETLGLVGESGCGKTTLGRALLRLNRPVSGRIEYLGRELLGLPSETLRPFRKEIQMVFQDPYSALNPRLTIGEALAEPLKIHYPQLSRSQRNERVLSLLEKVNLPAAHTGRYPHEFSGGQRQRIVIARALALDPAFVVFDESVSALDMSVQAQVLNLINDLKREFGFTAVFISHDLAVIRYLCDRVMVMESGRIVELGEAETIYNHPGTAYTKKLIDAIPGKSLAGN
ncbi:MAG TPA: ABC transporter ATP-binding protein [Puia sp.]|nr:ABC transporter ATP-binding protein [Puia sp.]